MSIFTQDKIEKYADVMTWALESARKGGRTHPYETVLVRYYHPALPLAEALHRRLLEKRLNVVVRCLSNPAMEKDLYTLADNRQLGFTPAGEMEFYENLAGNIVLLAPESITHLKDVDPKKFGVTALARKPIRDILDRREEQGKFSWTLCMFPTGEPARQAGLSLREYAAQVEKACFLNEKDPVAKWKAFHKDCAEIKKWLNSLPVKTFHIESKDTDLEVLFGDKRRFMGGSGHNIPSFEIFTSPDWRGTRGVYYADFPSFKNGNYVKGIRLVFENGKAVKITAEKGGGFVKKMLAMDAGASALGEFSLTDRRFSKIDRFMADTLFDENYGGKHGNCHVAVGSAYSDTFAGDLGKLDKAAKARLGFNDSALHWDIVNTQDKRVTATLSDGKLVTIYENGQFKY